jgi:hypothetical protein
MKTEGWGDDGAVEIQGLTASKFLPQLTQHECLWGGRYTDTPPRNRCRIREQAGWVQMFIGLAALF